MNDNQIVDRILSKYPGVYEGEKGNILIPSLEKMSPVLKKALVSFLETDRHEDITLLGFSVEKLTGDEYGRNAIAAYFDLDWIIRDPDEAIASLKRNFQELPPKFSNAK